MEEDAIGAAVVAKTDAIGADVVVKTGAKVLATGATIGTTIVVAVVVRGLHLSLNL